MGSPNCCHWGKASQGAITSLFEIVFENRIDLKNTPIFFNKLLQNFNFNLINKDPYKGLRKTITTEKYLILTINYPK